MPIDAIRIGGLIGYSQLQPQGTWLWEEGGRHGGGVCCACCGGRLTRARHFLAFFWERAGSDLPGILLTP